MEFKTLFYIVAITLWLIFKFLENKKDLLKKITQTFESTVATQKPPVVKPVFRKTTKIPIVKKVQNTELRSKNVSPVEKLQTETSAKVKAKEEIIVSSETPSLIDEIREGNVDWRKAILLSEILRPV